MQRKTEEIQLAVQEYLDRDWSNVKYYFRKQIAKCVNECKSQASNAKRIVGTIRHHKSKDRTTAAAPVENGEYYDSDDDYDYWDSDFDEDFDDEINDDISSQPIATSSEDVVPSNLPFSSGSHINSTTTITNQTKFIPKPPDVPVVSSTFSPNSQKPLQKNSIPRPPLKRPPSQPPPPPVAAQTSISPTLDSPLEDYEIPISHQGSLTASPTPVKPFEQSSSKSSSLSEISFSPETYEVITPPEENYEIVESPPLPVKTIERPILPPRSVATASRPCVPPPLPQKPKRLQEAQSLDKTDDCRPQTGPKLPIKEEDSGSEGTSMGGLGSVILNSFLGRKNSTPSPKLHTRTKDLNQSNDNISAFPQNSSASSSHASLFSNEKDGAFVTGCSSFIASASTSVSPEPIKSNYPQIPNEIGSSNMATRPLPPVPQVPQTNEQSNTVQDVSALPWFHEIERHEAEEEIQKLGQNGAFLVRPSRRAGKDNPYTLTCLHDGKVFHLNIRQRLDGTFALGKEKKKEKSFPHVAALINYHQNDPILLTSRGESAGQTILRVFPLK